MRGIVIRIILLGKVVPKARPRFSSRGHRGHVHLPPKYAEWKESAVIDLMNTKFVAIGKISLEITFINAIRGMPIAITQQVRLWMRL